MRGREREGSREEEKNERRKTEMGVSHKPEMTRDLIVTNKKHIYCTGLLYFLITWKSPEHFIFLGVFDTSGLGHLIFER